MAGKIVTDFIKMQLFKRGGAIANDKAVKFSADALEKRIKNLGVDPNTLNNQTELKQLLAYLKQMEDQQFNQAFSGIMNKNIFQKQGEVIEFPQKRSFADEIAAMKKSGDIIDEKDIKISDKIKEREMFKNSNLNKPNKTDEEYKKMFEDQNKQSIKNLKDKIKKEDDPEFYTGGRAGFADGLHAEKKPKINLRKLYERMLRHNDQPTTIDRSILRDLMEAMEDKGAPPNYNVADDVPKEMEAAQGGIAKFYTGGMVDVEPNLSDIGHGSDALMARTRLMSPGSQTTTSTGLNYLLAEDNDNLRVPFSDGGMGRRAFLKLLATLTGGAAAFKTGILGLGEGTAKKAVSETVKKSMVGSQPPPYFFRLVEKIKFMGDDTLASQDKAIAKKYKDYVMEEDFAGNITIIKKNMDNPYPEEVVMNYKVDDVSLKNKKGYAKAEDYEEFTVTPDGDGKMKDIAPGVPDEVINEAGDTTAMTLKKADGGRINFRVGGSPRKFLEKVFGKEKFKMMIDNDPELEQGLLEVVEMFRKKDKEGLKMYMQKFLPHMDDATVEDFIIGSGGTEGIEGQLIRLGSGRDYAGKIEMMKKADNMRKLDNLDVTEEMIRKPNASGGIQTMLGE